MNELHSLLSCVCAWITGGDNGRKRRQGECEIERECERHKRLSIGKKRAGAEQDSDYRCHVS